MRRMLPALALMGSALVYRTPDGRTVIDEDSLEDDNVDFAGDYVDDYDDDLEFGGDYDDDDDDDLEFGARRTRAQRRGGRRTRQDQRRGRRRTRQDQRAGNRGRSPAAQDTAVNGAEGDWSSTILGDSVVTATAGPGSIKIIPQHDFIAEDMTFEGSAAGAKVTSIFFGERPVFSSSSGIPVAVFASGAQIRKHLNNTSIKAGLTITINVTTKVDADEVNCVITGKKPNLGGC